MPRRTAMLLHDDTGAIAREDSTGLPQDAGEAGDGAIALPWLFPWLLALTGILITLALMR